MDLAAATKLQEVRQKLRTGPWNTGELDTKGFVVTEPLTADQGSSDNIKRYTDRYLRRKTIGRTIEDYAFKPEFLPPELHRPVGLKRAPSAVNGSGDPKDPAARLASVVSAVERGESREDGEKDGEDDDDDNENEAEVEDEFEELDDDDYNAEKYFDDGDDDEGDDGDNEAVY